MRRVAFCLIITGLALCSDARADLIAAYDFEAGTQLTDRSGSGNHLTSSHGSTTFGATSGLGGSGAYTFDGNDQLRANVDVDTDVMPQMTWGAWARTDSLTVGLRKVLGSDGGAYHRVIGLDTRAGDSQLRYSTFAGGNTINGNTGEVVDTPGANPTSTSDWAFIAASYDETTNDTTFYFDLDASSTEGLNSVTWNTSFGNSGQSQFVVGGLRPDGMFEGWVGAIDNVFVFDEVLDEATLTGFRNGGFNAVLGAAVPEPSAALLFAVLIGPITLWRRKRVLESA